MTEQEDELDFSLVLASSVHDMKNSIGMLVASVESIVEEQPPANPEQAQRFNTLQYEASRINGELVQLLTIYRMQNNRLPTRIDHHYVIDVLEDQLARAHGLIESKQINVTLNCDSELQWYLDGDLIGSVIQNVLVNCCRYTNGELELTAKEEGGYLSLTIADDGDGYPSSMIEGEALEVPDADVSDGSTRLGLYFAQKIAQLHRVDGHVGHVTLSNGFPLGGGVFKLRIP